MAALGFVDAIGLVGDALGLIQFGLDNFVPDQQDAQGTIVGIKGGDGEGASDTLGGTISQVYAYNSQNENIGQADSQSMAGNADYLTFTADQDVPGAQGQFVGIQNSDDATCISWITVKQFDNSLGGAWTGDIGRQCGQTWFASQEVAGQLDDGTVYRPACTWLDANHDSDIPSAALKFATYAYGNDTSHITLDQDACASTIFGPDEAEITDRPADPSQPSGKKRSVKSSVMVRRNGTAPSRPTSMEGKLVISHIDSHTAADLCQSLTSLGPDFVGSDGHLCDMGTKTLYPLCSTSDVDGCVEISTDATKSKSKRTSTVTQKRSIARREVSKVFKNYHSTSVWEGDN